MKNHFGNIFSCNTNHDYSIKSQELNNDKAKVEVMIPINKQKSNLDFNQGKWSKDEICSFLIGLINPCNNWSDIQAQIQTRSVLQARSFCQKFFLKLKKDK